jgi:hypothetical protein
VGGSESQVPQGDSMHLRNRRLVRSTVILPGA